MENKAYPSTESLADRLNTTMFAFRGYNVTNMGRTPELLAHKAYGPIVKKHLIAASELLNNIHESNVDLVADVEADRESTLETYAADVAMIVAVELAQLAILQQFFDIDYTESLLSCGYSLGEVTALIAGGVYDFPALMKPLLTLAPDAAELATDVEMGIVFSRGPDIEMEILERHCLELTAEGKGTIAVSSYLSPNTVLLMGQGDTISRFKKTMKGLFPSPVHLRKNPHHWPPLHTPIVRQKGIPCRSAVAMETVSGGLQAPTVPILSFVTGDRAYTETNSREVLDHWTDHPQYVWDVIDESLASGVETIIHVGPQPNIIPATFDRLSNNIQTQLNRRSLSGLGLRAVSRFVNRPWLAQLLRSDATLLRAPMIAHVFLEDWLLNQEVD